MTDVTFLSPVQTCKYACMCQIVCCERLQFSIFLSSFYCNIDTLFTKLFTTQFLKDCNLNGIEW